MGNDYVREVVRLKLQLKIAQLSGKKLWFSYEVPEEFIRNRTRSAYDSGYEAGWRGWEYMNAYSRPHWQVAYRHGYSDAKTAIHEAANNLGDIDGN